MGLGVNPGLGFPLFCGIGLTERVGTGLVD